LDKGKSQISTVWRRLRKKKLAVVGLFILTIMLLVALFAGILTDYETEVIKMDMPNRMAPPSASHILGTDSYGRDIFARIIYGSRYSLSIGFLSVLFALAMGGALGSIAGYFGGKVDNIIMRIMDVFLAVPSIIMAIAIVSTLGTGFRNLIIAMAVSTVPTFARLLRSTILSIKDSDYVEAARAVGTSTPRIIIRHILPNSVGPVIVQTTFSVASSILSAAGLSFLGIGVKPPAPEWGAMLSEGKEFIRDIPHLVVFPGLAIALTVLALNLLGDGLRDALDPRLKQ
jgi:peptide/nickel transport system permease protein